MKTINRLLPMLFVLFVCQSFGLAQDNSKPFEPVSGQPGKDVVWVPTPERLVEKMLDVAKITSQDFVMDLGSGDGRNVIGAAKRGAQALGVEWEQNMVDLSKRRAAEAGVSEKAQFVQGDMYQADIAKASVMALFLLPQNMTTLLPKFLALRPGSRIVSNTFGFGDAGWEPDYTETIDDCQTWCNVLLWIVPAKLEGAWQMPQGTLNVTQKFQKVSGTLGDSPISDGKLRGNEVSFTVGNAVYAGRVTGEAMEGTVTVGGNVQNWRAVRK
jgi:SAM-dependent methyltransferase